MSGDARPALAGRVGRARRAQLGEPPIDEEGYRSAEDVFDPWRFQIGNGRSFGGVRHKPLTFVTYVEPLPTLGEIFNRSMVETMKSGFATTTSARQYLRVAEMYNLYGDPELPVIGR